jgi:hypothetical protein
MDSILLNFSVKVGRKNIFKAEIGNENLHEINDSES